MKQNLAVSRIYAVGQYQNITFTDTILDIPEEIALNPEAVSKLTELQLLRMEEGITRYYLIRTKYSQMPPEEALATIEAERTQIWSDFSKQFTIGA